MLGIFNMIWMLRENQVFFKADKWRSLTCCLMGSVFVLLECMVDFNRLCFIKKNL